MRIPESKAPLKEGQSGLLPVARTYYPIVIGLVTTSDAHASL